MSQGRSHIKLEVVPPVHRGLSMMRVPYARTSTVDQSSEAKIEIPRHLPLESPLLFIERS